MSLRPPARRGGFTLPELVMTIIVVGILAVMAAPRFMSSMGFASRGFYDEAQGVVRLAQKTAIAWRRTIFLCVSATAVTAISNNNCAAPVRLTHPTTPGGYVQSSVPAGVGVTLSPVGNFSFNGLGQPSATYTILLTSTITGDPVRQIVVEAQTGYAHR
jgi:MSHA pilin protein MshC